MREKLNENPLIQVAVIGVLALIVGFMILRAMSQPKPGTEQPDLGVTPAMDADAPGGPAPVPTAAPPAEAPAPGADASAPGQDNADASPPAANGEQAAPPPAASGNGSAFVAGPGLPKEIASAYADGKVIALLVVRAPAIDDSRLMPIVASLEARDDTAVFITKVFNIAKYSRITQGVNVERTPALVVVQPKRLTEGPMPVATVSYGYQGKQSAEQQIRDALYDGPSNLPPYPLKKGAARQG